MPLDGTSLGSALESEQYMQLQFSYPEECSSILKTQHANRWILPWCVPSLDASRLNREQHGHENKPHAKISRRRQAFFVIASCFLWSLDVDGNYPRSLVSWVLQLMWIQQGRLPLLLPSIKVQSGWCFKLLLSHLTFTTNKSTKDCDHFWEVWHMIQE